MAPSSAPSAVDIAIVGGGIAGASIAAELAGTRSVVLLEQEADLGHHTTGRSAAVLLESYGGPEIRALTRASHRMLDRADDEAPILTPRHLLWVADHAHEGAIGRLIDEQPTLRALSEDEAQAMCPPLRREAVSAVAYESAASDIDVAALLQRDLRRAVAAGTSVQRSSRLERAERVGDRWLLHHASGSVSAEVVVDAAGAWADDVATLLGAQPVGLRPLRRTIAIARTGHVVDPDWPMVASIDEGFYFRPEGPHVLVSPADEHPSEPCDARPEEEDVALALDRVNEVTDLGLRSVVSAWAGLRTFATDRRPVVGFDPDVPGLFWLAGQGGYGIQTAPALARLAAALVRQDAGAADLVPDLDPAALSPSRFR